jgi:hypothetical protein
MESVDKSYMLRKVFLKLRNNAIIERRSVRPGRPRRKHSMLCPLPPPPTTQNPFLSAWSSEVHVQITVADEGVKLERQKLYKNKETTKKFQTRQ